MRGLPEGGRPLRHERLWKAMGLAFVLLVVYLSLARVPRELQVTGIFNVGHLVAYFWLMIWFAQIYRGSGVRWLWGAAFCALGIALEFVQGATGYRSFAYSDMALDVVGVGIGLALARTPAENALAALEAWLAARGARSP